jgi:O-antigen/teichoic acid export membrane protein
MHEKLMNAKESPVARDRYSLNVVAESSARALSFIGGLVSTVILWRSVAAGSWTLDEYGALKVLSSANQILLPLIVLGLTGAITRVVAEYSTDRRKLGASISFSLVIVTAAYVVTALVSCWFDFGLLLLGSEMTGTSAEDLRLFWFLVIITLLPTAYLRVAKAAFAGIQRVRKSLIIDITYNLIRTITLIYLFFNALVSIRNILLLNLLLVLVASIMALVILKREMKRNEVPWEFHVDRIVLRKLGRFAGVFLLASLVTTNLNSVMVLWVNAFGTLADVGLYTIAQGITVTAKMILAAPIVALGPNLTMEFGRNRIDQVRKKFREGYRMIVPTLSFTFAVVFAFSGQILRVMYGADALMAVQFLQLLSFEILFVRLSGIHTYIYLAADNAKGVLYASIAQILLPMIWIIVTLPLMGIMAVALVWIVYIPFFFVQNWYAKRTHDINMDVGHIGAHVVLGLIFASGMFLLVPWIATNTHWIIHLFVTLFQIFEPYFTIIHSLFVVAFVVPLWYAYVISATLLHIIDDTDLKNMESVLKVIPPIWWISKPITRPLLKYVKRRAQPLPDTPIN